VAIIICSKASAIVLLILNFGANVSISSMRILIDANFSDHNSVKYKVYKMDALLKKYDEKCYNYEFVLESTKAKSPIISWLRVKACTIAPRGKKQLEKGLRLRYLYDNR
jgi:hypothetical protein